MKITCCSIGLALIVPVLACGGSDDSQPVECTEYLELLPADVADGAVLPANTCYFAEQPLSVAGGNLYIEEGVVIQFGQNAHLTIRTGGALTVVGIDTRPVLFTSDVAATGAWKGVNFDDSASSDNDLDYLIIENAGSSGWSGAGHSTSALILQGNTHVDIRNTVIDGSGGQGLTVYGDATLSFENSSLSNNAVAAWLHPNTVGFISGDTVFADNLENVVRVVFGNTDKVLDAQQWPALDVPYEIRDRFFIQADLSLEAGATLQFVGGANAIVDTEGSLSASGTASAPITFTSTENLSGFWKGIRIATASTSNLFEYVNFENGGSDAWTGSADSIAMVYLDADSKAEFSNCTFQGSDHYALSVPGTADISGFANNVVTDNARTMIVHPERVGAIAANNEFSANTENKVRVTFGNTDTLTSAQTWQDTGVPFFVMDRTFIEGALTLDEGVEVEFAQNANLVVREGGTLTASGTSANKVELRGSEDLSGYWKGVQFDTSSASNSLTHVNIRNGGSQQWHGGADSTASIHVTADGTLGLADVTFASSGGYAVVVENGGALTCASVDDGSAGYYSGSTGMAQATCP